MAELVALDDPKMRAVNEKHGDAPTWITETARRQHG